MTFPTTPPPSPQPTVLVDLRGVSAPGSCSYAPPLLVRITQQPDSPLRSGWPPFTAPLPGTTRPRTPTTPPRGGERGAGGGRRRLRRPPPAGSTASYRYSSGPYRCTRFRPLFCTVVATKRRLTCCLMNCCATAIVPKIIKELLPAVPRTPASRHPPPPQHQILWRPPPSISAVSRRRVIFAAAIKTLAALIGRSLYCCHRVMIRW